MIEVKNLYKRYGSHVAVKDVSFNIKEGEIVGFLGPNGAGKSTTMNILTGYLSPTAGRVSVAGFNIMDDPKEAKKHIGYLPEQPPLYLDMTVMEYLEFMFDLKKSEFPKAAHLNEICRLVKIDNVKNRLIKNLSKGYRQRVGIAQVLIGNPEVLILDEPTVGLDPMQIIEIRNLIKQLGKNHTVILSSHILQEIQAVCKRIIIINHGKLIADGKPWELSEKMTTEDFIKIRVKSDEETVSNILSSMENVKSFEFLGVMEANTSDFSVIANDGTDIREELIEKFKGLGVLSISTGEPTLEEIFLNLTSVDYSEEAENEDVDIDLEQTDEEVEE